MLGTCERDGACGKRAGHVLSMHEALSSLKTTNQQNKNKKQNGLGNALNTARSQLRSTGQVDSCYLQCPFLASHDKPVLLSSSGLCFSAFVHKQASLCSLLHPLPGPWIKN